MRLSRETRKPPRIIEQKTRSRDLRNTKAMPVVRWSAARPMSRHRNTHELSQEGDSLCPPDVGFLTEILAALMFLAAVSGTVVFVLL